LTDTFMAMLERAPTLAVMMAIAYDLRTQLKACIASNDELRERLLDKVLND